MAKILVFSAILLLSFNNCSETLFSVNSKSSPSVAPLVDPTVEDQSAQIIESDRIDGVTCGPESQYPHGQGATSSYYEASDGFCYAWVALWIVVAHIGYLTLWEGSCLKNANPVSIIQLITRR